MNNLTSKLFRFLSLIVHSYYCFMVFKIWGVKIRTFLFLTKINFFINFFLFIYLNLNSFLQFDSRPEILEKSEKNSTEKAQKIHIQYTKNEMSLIRAGFSFSLTVNFLYWTIILFKPDFMGTGNTPIDVELFLHGGNSLVILLEGYLNKKSLHENVRFGSLGVILFAFFYITLKYIVYYLYDIQIYPMISKLNVVYYYCLGIIAYFMYLISVMIFRFFIMEKFEFVRIEQNLCGKKDERKIQ